jgi:ribosomal protein S18 acetylase RimI-like enzyme
VVDLINASYNELIGVPQMFKVEDFEPDWNTPGFNIATDTCLVFDEHRRVVGYEELWDLLNPSVRVRLFGHVHPDYKQRGVGTSLLTWAKSRAQRAVQRAPHGARVVMQAHVLHKNLAGSQLLIDLGFQPIRRSLRMVIDLNGRPPEPQLPPEICIRPMILGIEEPAIVQAVRDSFQDHWGYVLVPFEEDLARWKHVIETDTGFDPGIWFVAMDGEEIAGISLCFTNAFDDLSMGWVGTLGVRRDWRRKGIGLALLQHSFRAFYQRGKRKVGLGVDGESLTNATRLYEKAGMRSDPNHTYDLFEIELRPGVELSTQSLE